MCALQMHWSRSLRRTIRVLIITPSFPYPPDGGAELRYYHLIKRLSLHYKLSLLTLTAAPVADRFVEKMHGYCEEVVVIVRHRAPRWWQIPSLMRLLSSGKPFCLKYYNDLQLCRTLNEMLSRQRYDILQIEHSELGGLIRALAAEQLADTRTLLTFHNILHLRERYMLAIERRPYERIKMILNWLPMKAWEKTLATEFDACIAMSPFDSQALASLTSDSKLFIVPNGVDTHALQPLPFHEDNHNLLFVGDCGYPPNRDAVLWFYEEIFGLIRNVVPDVHLAVVGKGPDHCIRTLAADPSVSVLGHVEDVAAYYEHATISIVPLRAGGGTRLKILEAMAFGRPVVSTSIGCQGLNVSHGQNILIADDPKSFAELVVKLFHDTRLRQRLIGDARQLVVSEYDWDVLARIHSDVYQWLVSPASGSCRAKPA